MDQCTAMTLISPPAHLADLLANAEPAHVLCELGEGHEGDHAQMLWDDDANDLAAWARWNERRVRLVPRPWCPENASSGEEEVCGLFAGHPSGHSWEVTDPTREALCHALAMKHPDLFPECTGPEDRAD
ncbi:hypothetical protein [Streptomyces nitrosporeus]|uniref:hypothetical protein n=1 Tax=Streptomyces nitrosporeus TaxID=28894 RepID=UPI00331A73E2